jgi:GAF domain-containing protein
MGGGSVTEAQNPGSNRIGSQIAPAHPSTVEVLAGLIAELDSGTEAGEFHDHVCEALCRLTSMERAGVFLYDSASRAVRPVGSHGVDKSLMDQIEGTLDETPIAQRALAEDTVVAASENLERELPARYAQFAGITTVTCTPVAAGGRWFGVIFADQGGGQFEPSETDQQTMLTLGRLAALAASVERATRQEEHSRQLGERVGLVRDIHERVMQRLFGLTLVLGSGELLGAEDLRACHDELQVALRDLRSALGRPISEQERRPRTTLGELVQRPPSRQRGRRHRSANDDPRHRNHRDTPQRHRTGRRNDHQHRDRARQDRQRRRPPGVVPSHSPAGGPGRHPEHQCHERDRRRPGFNDRHYQTRDDRELRDRTPHRDHRRHRHPESAGRGNGHRQGGQRQQREAQPPPDHDGGAAHHEPPCESGWRDARPHPWLGLRAPAA